MMAADWTQTSWLYSRLSSKWKESTGHLKCICFLLLFLLFLLFLLLLLLLLLLFFFFFFSSDHNDDEFLELCTKCFYHMPAFSLPRHCLILFVFGQSATGISWKTRKATTIGWNFLFYLVTLFGQLGHNRHKRYAHMPLFIWSIT